MNKVFINKEELLNYAKEIFGADSKQVAYLNEIKDFYILWTLENVLAGMIMDKK